MYARILRKRALATVAALSVGLSVAVALASEVPTDGFRVVASYPHDHRAFTQGLVFADGELYEGTGHYGRSTLRRVDLETGQVLQQVALPRTIFGEGVTVWGDEIVQLSWRAGLGMRYDRRTFEPVGEFALPGEGWGITQDGRHWIVSDGSDQLRFLDPREQREVRRLAVRDGSRPVYRLNELELVNGEIWANIWYDDRLVRISPETGAVLGYVDLAGLWPRAQRPAAEAVLNGIAYDRDRGRLFVTGKYWPRVFQIEVVAGDCTDAAGPATGSR
ncbi:MAG: glutaminyl-peptide cyclotransferase [Thiohalocapsa sp.]|jgi:glutamine cyclotransferase